LRKWKRKPKETIMAQHQQQHQSGGGSHEASTSFQLRGTHLYLMLDDTVESPTGLDDILKYLNFIATSEQLVESVFVKGGMSRNVRRISEDTAIAVFRALSTCLPHITRLEVSGDGRFGGLYLPVKAMTAALQQSCRNQLTNLRMGHVILTTSSAATAAAKNADMQALAMALQKLPKLTSVDLVRCRSEELAANITLGPLVQAIAAMPHLQQAMFCETVISARTGLYLGELCKSTSIQKL